jgi:hypothetical protein
MLILDGLVRPSANTNSWQCSFESTVGLALNIDDGNDRALYPSGISSNCVTHVSRERPSLVDTEFAVPGSRKTILRIRHNCEQSHRRAR